jgi:DNA-binding response OmpR family regulator
MSPEVPAEAPQEGGADELAIVLRQTRDRFVASFPARFGDLQAGITALKPGEMPSEDLRGITHRLAGLAGTVGFPSVSQAASELETLLCTPGADRARLIESLLLLRAAFDGAGPPADAPAPRVIAPAQRSSAPGQRIVVVDDDDEQRRLTTAALASGGYEVIALSSAEAIIDTAFRERPVAVLLDVMMPGINGHLACRLLKTEPDLAGIPVVFVSSNSALEERLAGLALGAVDYVAKPFEVHELLFRVKRAIEQKRAPAAPPAALPDVLEYGDFVTQAGARLADEPCTLALVRVDANRRDHVARRLVEESRRRDLVGQYDRLHLVLLYPSLATSAVSAQLGPLLDSLSREGADARAGLAGAGASGSLDALIEEADEALAGARFHGLRVAVKGDQPAAVQAASSSQVVLLADDDPEVMRIVDAQIRSLRFTTTLAFDGQAAMTTLSTRRVHLLILDLMLPKVTGFEILHHLRAGPEPRPRSIVLSARGREEDITRAFDLGADDYITKPFRPQELAARVVRLLR